MNKTTTIQRKRRNSGFIIALEKLAIIGASLGIGVGLLVFTFTDLTSGITDFADIQITNFETQRNGDRLTMTATIKNAGNTPIDSLTISQFTAGDLTVVQDTSIANGEPTGKYGTVTVSGYDGSTTLCTSGVTEVDGATQNMVDVVGSGSCIGTGTVPTIEIDGVSRGDGAATPTITQNGIDGKGSIVIRMVIVADAGIDITDSANRNDPTSLSLIYLVGGSEQTSKTAAGKVRGN